jgi:hypothetical protein
MTTPPTDDEAASTNTTPPNKQQVVPAHDIEQQDLDDATVTHNNAFSSDDNSRDPDVVATAPKRTCTYLRALKGVLLVLLLAAIALLAGFLSGGNTTTTLTTATKDNNDESSASSGDSPSSYVKSCYPLPASMAESQIFLALTRVVAPHFMDHDCFPASERQANALWWLANEDASPLAALFPTPTPSTGTLQRFLAVLLYQSMGGGLNDAAADATDPSSLSWGESDPWLSNASTCSWYGIRCTTSGLIWSLQLSNSWLEGDIPTELGLLTNLAMLDMCK